MSNFGVQPDDMFFGVSGCAPRLGNNPPLPDCRGGGACCALPRSCLRHWRGIPNDDGLICRSARQSPSVGTKRQACDARSKSLARILDGNDGLAFFQVPDFDAACRIAERRTSERLAIWTEPNAEHTVPAALKSLDLRSFLNVPKVNRRIVRK